MGTAKTNNAHKQCPLIQNCPADNPTKVANLGCRFALTLISYAVLGLGIAPGQGFFVSLALFAVPLFMDYLKFVPDTALRNKLRWLGLMYTSYCGLVAIFGLTGILVIQLINETLYMMVSQNYIVLRGALFPLESIWYSVGVGVFLTCVDWIIYRGYLEADMTNKKR